MSDNILAAYPRFHCVDDRTVVPAEVLARRDREQEATPTLGMLILGDPLPGRSALDRYGEVEVSYDPHASRRRQPLRGAAAVARMANIHAVMRRRVLDLGRESV